MDDVELYPFALSMDDPDLTKPLFPAFQQVLLKQSGDVFGRKGVQVNPVLNGNGYDFFLFDLGFQSLTSQGSPDDLEDPIKHGPGQLAGLCVLLARMVGYDEGNRSELGVRSPERIAGRNRVNPAMTKFQARHFVAGQTQGPQGLGKRDLSQSQDDFDTSQQAEFFQKVRPAVFDLPGERLICGRSTADRGRDVAVP